MTIQKCATACAGFKCFGVEWATECYRGNTLNTGSGIVDDSVCSFACGGSDAENCGAGDHLDLFQFGPRTPSPVTTAFSSVSIRIQELR